MSNLGKKYKRHVKKKAPKRKPMKGNKRGRPPAIKVGNVIIPTSTSDAAKRPAGLTPDTPDFDPVSKTMGSGQHAIMFRPGEVPESYGQGWMPSGLQIQLALLMADPQEEASSFEKAKSLKIPYRTFYNWKNDLRFVNLVNSFIPKLALQANPQVWATLMRKAIAGDNVAMSMFFQLTRQHPSVQPEKRDKMNIVVKLVEGGAEEVDLEGLSDEELEAFVDKQERDIKKSERDGTPKGFDTEGQGPPRKKKAPIQK